MAEVEAMKIDSLNEMKPKNNDPGQKKKPLKRKRLDPSLYTASPEEKQAKIDSFRNEINSLVKFYKKLVVNDRGNLMENVEKIGLSSASLNGVIACLMEGSDLSLSKLVDEISEKVKGRFRNGESVTKASVKSTVLMIGQRLCYGVSIADADLLEDEAECALWCWETRDLKLMPKLVRGPVKVGRTCRKKIHERITALLAMLRALEKSDSNQNCQQELIKALEKLDKVLNEADIRLLMENLSQKSGAEMAEKEAMKEQKLLIKQMEKNKREMEKDRKKMERELQKEKVQSEKELKRLQDEAEKEVKRHEQEEREVQKQPKRQREEAEKDKIHKEKEEAELKKQLARQKQALLMERFLKGNKTIPTSQPESLMNKATTSQLSSKNIERKFKTVTAEMDSVLAQNVGFEAEAIWKSHLNSWRSIRPDKNIHWGIRQKPKTEVIKELKLTTDRERTCDEDLVVEKLADGWNDSIIDGRLSQMDIDRPLANSHKGTRSKQLLQFDKSYRPAFYGIWPWKSLVVGARHPLAKDPDIDYEIDSDEEWEEDEPGESLSDCDKDEEDESVEGHLKDEDESEDGFFVPDGYLSENEGVEADDLVMDVGKLSDSENKMQSVEFCTLLRLQKYLNNMTEQALKKNQPIIILNLMHEKTTLLPGEEFTGAEKFEQICLQTLSIRSLLDAPSIEISTHSDVVDEEFQAPSDKSSTMPATMPDSDLPQIISIIHSCPHGIGKIVESLHDVFPTLPKSQLRNQVREISEFSENRWKVKKDILSKLGLSASPEKKYGKTKSIATFFSKRCLPPSGNTINFSETC